ncbi:CapA family protein [Tepidibacillus fermentans]|uniref:Poly-gamma-glutamate synthesis protein (Capsule biosynthesis protein) n=1 Tax=Tepidibacillus fermentans TaxID=1281767 RepID=A0A4R3KLW8_9BACI|nr:CapA family protein [Tepidibacillus fermentans]TCS84436.1 poly-gamma-glutamate synthesis protein (capsule biosynthesis protein) [Tepidibacillus fermentans]
MSTIHLISILLSVFLTFSPISTNDEARVMVVGDVMMHLPITQSGYDSKTQNYQFDSIFQEVKPIFAQADLVIGNLETPLAGEARGFSGYPLFNAPKEIALALKNAGFDVLTTANNHVLDQHESGIIQTLHYLDQYGLFHTGSFKSQIEREKPLIINVHNIKMGIIAYTYGTNGLPIPKGKPYLVNILNLNQIKEDVKRLKANDVDYILAMIHYGTEYQRLPNQVQKKWTRYLLNSGVDFVLGSHPHVVQTMELIKGYPIQTDRGVIYSMGNFLSGQIGEWKDYGIILNLKLEKNRITRKVRIKEASIIPIYIDRYDEKGKRKYMIRTIFNDVGRIDPTIIAKGKELVQHVMRKQ